MIVQLGGGLDLVTAKTHANPGTLQDCMNFECAFTAGYRRIDGFLRYDGRAVPGKVQLYTLRAEYASNEHIVNGLPLYETTTGIGAGIWPPESFDKLSVGDEIKYQRLGRFLNFDLGVTLEWNGPITGYIVDVPEFVERGDVDLSNRTGLILFTEDLPLEGNIIAPNIDPRFYGSRVISDARGYRTEFIEGFGGNLVVGTPPGSFGVFNNQPQSVLVDLTDESAGLPWLGYNLAWKQNLDAYRQTVTEFPGGTALGMTYYRDTLYAVAETTSWNYTLEDESLLNVSVPRQWAYFERQHVIQNQGPLGFTNPRSVLEGDLQSCRLMQFKDGQVELLMPALDPALPTEGQDPQGRSLFLLTEIVFWKDEVFPQVGDIVTDGVRTAEVMFVVRDSTDPDIPTEWTEFENNGVMLVRGDTSVWGKGSLLEVQGKTGEMVVWSAFGASSDNPVITVGTLEETDRATVVRSTQYSGFAPLEMGYEIQFTNGETAMRDVYTQAAFGDEPDDVHFSARDVPPEAANWVAPGGAQANFSGDVGNISQQGGGTMDANLTAVTANRREVILRVSGFDLDVPQGTTIRGIELMVRARTARTDGNAQISGVVSSGFGAPGYVVKSILEPLGTSFVNYTVGGEDDLWGFTTLSPANVNNLAFNVSFRINGPVGGGGTDFLVDHVALTITYSDRRTTTVYFRMQGGADVASGELVYTHVDSGSFDDNDASGVMTVRLRTATGGVPTQSTVDAIRGFLEIRTQANGGGTFIAHTHSGAQAIRLPGMVSMQEEKSRYQFIHRNFFATDFLDAVYGVNGAGPAFTFNDNYFIRIRTGIGEEKNKPRHVEDFASSLVLGYGTGEFNVSVPNEPLDFRGEAGAFADGVGEAITGMLELQGTTLAIFTNRRITGYQLGGAGELIPITISPSTGAIEYTVVDMGFPVYCDFRGISTISTSEKYGDFERGRFSYNVSRWLTPRLQGVREEGSIASDPNARDIESQYGVAGVLLVRNKSQYRVIFNDGYVMTMTLLGDTPEFTIQRYWTKRDDAGELEYEPEPMRLWAAEFGTTSSGQDRIFVSALNYQFVLEMDRGDSFDGLPIESYLVANIMNFQSPGINKRYNIIHYHGLVGGYANFRQSFGVDYAEPDPEAHSGAVKLGNENNNWYRGPRPAFAKARTDSRGRDITIRIDHVSDLEAPFTLQTLEWLDVSPRRPER